MASSAPRPGYTGHPQGPPDALAAGIQNLYVTRPNAPVTRPPPFAGAGSSPMPIARTDAPTYAPPLRGVSPPPFVTGNIGPGRPMGFAQPPPRAASRPGPFSASPPSSGPTAISNGPAAFVPPGSRFPPTVQGPPGLARGPPPPPGVRPMADSQNVPGILPQVQQSRAPFLGGSQGVPGPMMQPQATPFVGASHASVAPPMQAAPAPFSGGQSGSPTMRPPAPPFLGATQSVPPLMQAPPAPFMGSSQPMPPPMQQPPPPFVGGSQVMPPPPPPTSLPYDSQPWPSQLAQTPQVINLANAPSVVGKHLDDECLEDFIKGLILFVSSFFHVERRFAEPLDASPSLPYLIFWNPAKFLPLFMKPLTWLRKWCLKHAKVARRWC